MKANDFLPITRNEIAKNKIENYDFASLISYSGPEIKKITDEIIIIRDLDICYDSATALKKILENLFNKKVKNIDVFFEALPQPNTFALKYLIHEVFKNSKDKEEAKSIFVERLSKMISDDAKDFSLNHEINSLIKVNFEEVKMEGIILNLNPMEFLEHLKKMISETSLKKYLIDRRELFFLIGFSFLADISNMDKISLKYWFEMMKMEKSERKEAIEFFNNCDTADLRRILEQAPAPIDNEFFKPLILEFQKTNTLSKHNEDTMQMFSPWMIHIFILDRNYINAINVGLEYSPITTPLEMARLLIKNIVSHQELYLERVINLYKTYKDNLNQKELASLTQNEKDWLNKYENIKLNICFNMNIWK